MINKLINSITKQMGDELGSEYRYYVENVEQRLIRPCFTIDVLNPIKRSYSPNTYHITAPCIIHYFTNHPTTPKADAYAMGEKLLELLEYLKHEGRVLRAENMSYTLNEDVLQVLLTYRFYTETVGEEVDEMETLDNTGVTTI